MCCHLLDIPDMAKPRQVWCTHCDKVRGCKIYDDRPAYCARYKCAYLTNAGLDERWKPSLAKFIAHAEGDQLIVSVDANRPEAWRKEPYFSSIKRWARGEDGFPGGVFVFEGSFCTFLHGSKEQRLGAVGKDQVVITQRRATPGGDEIIPLLVDRGDPRAVAVKASLARLPGLPG
jgi:hypothetical protein